jgi:type II secretory pathway pseudopilin PulG
MNKTTTTHRGFLMTELMVSLVVLGMLLIAFTISLGGFRRLNHYQLTKQHCISAAQATLDSIAATGAEIDGNDLKRLWPNISIRIDETEGTGQWNGLKLITVTAKGQSLSKKTEVRLSRYFSKQEQ